MMSLRNTLLVSFAFALILNSSVDAQKDSIRNSPKSWSAGSKEIWQTVDGILNDPNLASTTWGVVIQSITSGEILYKRNENKLLNSASLIKLFTTGAALAYLGSDFVYETQIKTSGTIEGDKLKGDLIIVGSGDPTISGRFQNNDTYSIFNSWADRLIELGVLNIDGNLIGDDLYFETNGIGRGWNWDYLGEWYAARSSALAFNDNSVDVTILPGDVGLKAEIDMNPLTKFVSVINDLQTVGQDSITAIEIQKVPGNNIIQISGTIKASEKPVTKSFAIDNPNEFFLQSLKEVLHKRGIKIRGDIKLLSNFNGLLGDQKTTTLFKHKSKPLSEIIKVCNKNSYNFYAEQILKTIGLVEYGKGSVKNGIAVVNNHLKKSGIDPATLNIVDGSGLSLLNLTSAEHFARYFRTIFKSEDFSYFYNSLPVAGRDGSLADRLLDASATNNLRAKPGLNENVRSLGGYIKTADNEMLSVVFIANNFLVPYTFIDNIIDKICNRLSILKRKK